MKANLNHMSRRVLQGISKHSQYQLRAESEAMVLGDLLGSAGGVGEDLSKRMVHRRYHIGVLTPSHSADFTPKMKTACMKPTSSKEKMTNEQHKFFR